MKKLPLIYLLATVTALATGCTDTQKAQLAALGDAGRVTCFSGGNIVFDDFLTGKIQNPEGSDGFEFKSATTQRLEQVTGDCVVDYGAKMSTEFKAVLP